MQRFLHNHGLTLITFGLFFLCWIGMAIAGLLEYNQQQRDSHRAPLTFGRYLGTGHFWEASTENWESEFFQMGLFVLLTAYFFEKGSAISKTPEERRQEQQEEEEEQHGVQAQQQGKKIPWSIRSGGLFEHIYENSLSIALLGLFLLSFIGHALSGAREYNREQLLLHHPTVTTLQFMATPTFWFQSLQNWQSEFLAVGTLVVLSIFLRQKGSAESKRVGAPIGGTGEH